MASVIAAVIQLKDQFSATLANINKNLGQFQRNAAYAGKNITQTGKSMEKVGSSLIKSITLPIVGMGIAAATMSANFQHQMADIRKEVAATAGSTANANKIMDQMSKSSIQWSEQFGQSTDDINTSLLTLVKDGYNGKVAMDIMGISLQTARGSDEDLTTVVNSLGTSLEAYGLKTNNAAETTKNMTDLADTFAYVSNHTKASIVSLGDAFAIVGPTISAAKIPMEQTAAAIGELQSQGIDASTAATGLKSGIVNLTKPTAKMSVEIKKMGLHAFDLKGNMKGLPDILDQISKNTKGWTNQQKQAAIATVFGKESLAVWSALINKGGANLKTLSDNAKKASGETKKLADSMANTDVNKWNELKNSVKALAISFGNDLLPALMPIASKFTDTVKWLANMSDASKKTIIKIAAIAAVVGPAIFIVGKLTTSIGKTITKFKDISKAISGAGGIFKWLLLPGNLVVLIIVAIAVAAFLIIKYWGPISGFLKKIWSDILKDAQKVWGFIGPTIMGAVKTVQTYWNSVWPQISEVFIFIWKAMIIVLGPFLAIIFVVIATALGFIMGVWKDAWKIIGSVLKLAWDMIYNVIKMGWDLISGVFKIALDLLTGNWSKAWSDMKTLIGTMWGDIKTYFVTMVKDMWNCGVNIVKGLIDGIKNAPKELDDAVKWLADKIKTGFEKLFGIASPSKVFFGYGKFMIKGLMNGLSGSTLGTFAKNEFGKIKNSIGSVFSGSIGPVPGNLVDWITQACQLTGTSLANVPGLVKIAMSESTGNPNAVNNWDSNAMAGHPSQGLFQTIPTTFAAHMLPGHNSIRNPVDNAAAAIRYMISQYGSIGNVPGLKSLAAGGAYVGYANGTNYATAGPHWTGENGPELINFKGGETVTNAADSKKIAGSNIVINMNGFTVRDDADIDKITTALVKKLRQYEPNMA